GRRAEVTIRNVHDLVNFYRVCRLERKVIPNLHLELSMETGPLPQRPLRTQKQTQRRAILLHS
ncbi:MAG: hypothetical protein WCF61_16125, partial [Terriglobales bacterium]